jgi:hypothetical protein
LRRMLFNAAAALATRAHCLASRRYRASGVTTSPLRLAGARRIAGDTQRARRPQYTSALFEPGPTSPPHRLAREAFGSGATGATSSRLLHKLVKVGRRNPRLVVHADGRTAVEARLLALKSGSKNRLYSEAHPCGQRLTLTAMMSPAGSKPPSRTPGFIPSEAVACECDFTRPIPKERISYG